MSDMIVTAQSAPPIVVAVEDELIHAEAISVAAATSQPLVDVCDEFELFHAYHGAATILVDTVYAEALAAQSLPRRPGIYLVVGNGEDVDYECALRIHAEDVVVLPDSADGLVTALGKRESVGDGRVVGFTGVTGGCGCSTLACSFAVYVAADHPVVVDMNSDSGGLDLLLGSEETSGARWPDVSFTRGQLSAEDVYSVLPATRDGVACLTVERSALSPPEVSAEEYQEAIRTLGEDGIVVADLPRVGNLTPDALALCDHVVVLVPAEVRAASVLAAHVAMLRRNHVPCTFVSVTRRWASLSDDDVAQIAGVPVTAGWEFTTSYARTIEQHGIGSRLPRRTRKVLETIAMEAGL